MPSAWIVLSTRWSLSSVQASLNVIISVLGTIGLWAFTRYWWRRGGSEVIRNKTGVPLSKLFTISSPGESWDVVAILRRRVFAKENWHLLVQLIVVVMVTVSCALAGPIAKVSLRKGMTILSKELQVRQAVKGGGYFGNLLFAAILWNTTADNLNNANFPANQLLDFLPPSITPSWTYVESEWDPTWTVTCNYTDNITVHSMVGSGQYNIFQPIHAFPAFEETYPPEWLNKSKYRMTSDYNSWQDWAEERQIQETLFYVLVQSDPEIDDRMLYNNESLQLSLTVLHARNFRVLYEDTSGIGGEDTWRPIGPVGSASYSRAECELTRRAEVENVEKIPWPWTNDTLSIVSGYRNFFHDPFVLAAAKKHPVTPPSARDLFRFYQIYMASINTFKSDPSPKILSVKVETVELSAIFLAVLLLLFLMTTWSGLRYAWFLRRNQKQLQDLYVPDGKMEWMIHAVKCSESGIDLEAGKDETKGKDRDHFCSAVFGHGSTDSGLCDELPRAPRLARVMSTRSSVSDGSRKFSVSPVRSFTTNLSSLDEDHQGCMDLSPKIERTVSSSASSSMLSPHVMTRCSSHESQQPILVPSIDVQDTDVNETSSLGQDPQHSPTRTKSITVVSARVFSNSCSQAHTESFRGSP